MRILCVGDLHGRHEQATAAIDKFLKEKYDKIIFLGDYTDGTTRPDEDNRRIFNIILSLKSIQPDQVILLIGEQDEAMFRIDPTGYQVSGFKPTLHTQLCHKLSSQRRHFQYAYGINNYLFTHAGIQLPWFVKHFSLIKEWGNRMGLDIDNPKDLWMIIDGIGQTRNSEILHECGLSRGGSFFSSGGPLWCDRSEIIKNGPIPGYNQIVGHTSDSFIRQITRFGEGFSHKDTSVTFIDCLEHRTQFLSLTI